MLKKLLACLVLLGGIVALGGIDAPRTVQAQAVQKDAKKDAKKDDKTATGTVEISEGKDGKFRYAVRNAEGKYLGGSGPVGFATEKDAHAASRT